ncbi:bis(5'-nucleosyl)-tetraphosphatase (symmetrical) YqeK [Ruminococcus gauvreauii]|uniref:bis(5'-nucleosyl)-tetraphosphatase (symmetrical) YqeK n=1 Tax=Ruminococcus gauvreauii TaxID=438033 RepID=UPI00398413DA
MAEQKHDLIKLERKLKNYLDRQRFHHTMGVMYTAACMGMVHGGDPAKLQLAGLLHDCAKCIPDEKKLRLCGKFGITPSHYETTHPYMLHAKLGAHLAKKKFDIRDPEVLSAITWHTTGKAAMTVLEKIIYIADYIEPGRNKAPRLEEIRKMAFRDLDECMYMILHDTLTYLRSVEKEIDTVTESAYEYYCNLHNQG